MTSTPMDGEGYSPEAEAEPQSPWWHRFLPGRQQAMLQARITALDDAITLYPSSSANYVLRGEAYLKAGQAERAIIDFEIAQRLAQADIMNNRWGLVAQAMQDRARRGLQQARRHVKK